MQSDKQGVASALADVIGAKRHIPIYDIGSEARVPCGTCTACCYQAAPIRPQWGDDPSAYLTTQETDPRDGSPVLILRRREDGACVYLRDGACSIYATRPAICKAFDCRRLYHVVQMILHLHRAIPGSAQEIRAPAAMQAVLEAGKARSHLSDVVSGAVALQPPGV